jgi:hypothetical protein
LAISLDTKQLLNLVKIQLYPVNPRFIENILFFCTGKGKAHAEISIVI